MFLISLARFANSEDPIIWYGHRNETKLYLNGKNDWDVNTAIGIKLKFDKPKGGIDKISTGVETYGNLGTFLYKNMPWKEQDIIEKKLFKDGKAKTMTCTFSAAIDYVYTPNKKYDGRHFTFKANFMNIYKVNDYKYNYTHASYEITVRAKSFLYNPNYMPADYAEVNELSGDIYSKYLNYNLLLKGTRLNSNRGFALSGAATQLIVDMLKEKAKETKEAFFKLNF